jgi:adenine-specific DNA methylase
VQNSDVAKEIRRQILPDSPWKMYICFKITQNADAMQVIDYMDPQRQKELGAYYTPEDVVRTLVAWSVSAPTDRMLDPSCGDGRFLTIHPNSVGVEGDPHAAAIVHSRVPGSLIHQGDFFSWASNTVERFECAAGNPPFIRYQRFTGEIRKTALALCASHGARFDALASSWAPFLVATATLLKAGGRMAFVVPAEIGHAPYALPLLDFLVRNFDQVQLVAVQKKLFPELSQDCWLLYCCGFGGSAKSILMSKVANFTPSARPPRSGRRVSLHEIAAWGGRLRQFLLSDSALDLYLALANSPDTHRFDDIAKIGIGYVTGANEFFHLRPSVARSLRIPGRFLLPAVRSGRDLKGRAINDVTVRNWELRDEPHFLLRLTGTDTLPITVRNYLESSEGKLAQRAYKCKMRDPWYAVPDVKIPDAFLSYMSGEGPSLVANRAGCVATNAVHVIRLKRDCRLSAVQRSWKDPLTQLSCELEGHPLGGGMLKLEPREAGRILIRPTNRLNAGEKRTVLEAIETLKMWRHYG